MIESDGLRRSKTSTSMLTTNEATGDWVDNVVQVANTCKKLFTQNTCRLCQVYVDEQVEYERRCEESGTCYKSPSPFQRAWMNANLPEVELYRQFLFDEDSVVDVVHEREGKENENDSEDDEGSCENAPDNNGRRTSHNTSGCYRGTDAKSTVTQRS